VAEVGGQYGVGLGGQELPPGGTRAEGSGVDAGAFVG
jgi:hypothetical protein